MFRQPAVADRFYPGSRNTLLSTVRKLAPKDISEKKPAHGLICPHAGYIYSGKLACATITSTEIPETVMIIGPNHHGRGAPVALSMSDWNMPQGVVPIDKKTSLDLLSASPHITEDESAHEFEHSLEVQIPFLQAVQPQLSIVPIVVSHLSFQLCKKIAEAISLTIKNGDTRVLILASTDMSHYESRKSASTRDKLALDRITALDAEGLYQVVFNNNISMCGVIPVTITLLAAKSLGASKADLIGYTDSGVVSGDTDQVVGYAGFVIS